MANTGKIFDKTTGEQMATLPYNFELLPPPPGRVVSSASLRMDVPWRMGMEWQRDNRTLVLELNEGGFVDFAVTKVSQDSITGHGSRGPSRQQVRQLIVAAPSDQHPIALNLSRQTSAHSTDRTTSTERPAPPGSWCRSAGTSASPLL